MTPHRTGRLEMYELRRQLPEHRPQLPSGQVGAETEVLAEPEGEVKVRVAADVEAVRIGELALVSIGRRVPERHRVASSDEGAIQLVIRDGGASELDDRRGP